jgi:hypothetical protein
MMRDFGIYFLTVVLIICSFIYIIPNLSTDTSDYGYETKELENTRIDKREYYRKLRKRTEYTLVLRMTDGTEWYISDQYSDYWDKLKSAKNIGKKYKLYTGNNTSHYHNPVQIEIEGKVVYDLKERLKWSYLLILMTIGLSVYSFTKLKKKITKPNTVYSK